MAAKRFVAFALSTCLACSGADAVSSVQPGPLAYVFVTPTNATIGVGGSVAFHATELDSTGHFQLDYRVNWGVTNITIAFMSDSGVARGLAPGVDTVLAIVENKVGHAILRVQ